VLETEPARAAGLAAAGATGAPPAEFDWRDYTVFLLHVAAEIEHALMVQYLFAAYSLGADEDAPEPLQQEARAWQETILGIAKEEMGHLVTVQNLLTALGAPLNFDREDYPWGSPFYPFELDLQPLSRESLAAYVCAEAPDDWSGAKADEIRALAAQGTDQPVNRVGALYERLTAILSNPELIPDSAFDASTVPFQASWDEWGRGYREGARGQEAGNIPGQPAPDLLIVEVGSRQAAIDALNAIGEQGEGMEAASEATELSHFERFTAIFDAISALDPADLQRVVRRVARNPVTPHPLIEIPAPAGPALQEAPPERRTEITAPEALLWGHLFNLRYRMLLVNVSHAFRLADEPAAAATLSPRGALIHRTFAEMYNLRSIAGLLVRLPASGADIAGQRAGPPFEMPYSLDLPHTERGCWLLHRDLLDAAAALIDALEQLPASEGLAYLTALRQLDALERGQVQQLIDALTPAPAATNGGAP
jgi:hypothetical protein